MDEFGASDEIYERLLSNALKNIFVTIININALNQES